VTSTGSATRSSSSRPSGRPFRRHEPEQRGGAVGQRAGERRRRSRRARQSSAQARWLSSLPRLHDAQEALRVDDFAAQPGHAERELADRAGAPPAGRPAALGVGDLEERLPTAADPAPAGAHFAPGERQDLRRRAALAEADERHDFDRPSPPRKRSSSSAMTELPESWKGIRRAGALELRLDAVLVLASAQRALLRRDARRENDEEGRQGRRRPVSESLSALPATAGSRRRTPRGPRAPAARDRRSPARRSVPGGSGRGSTRHPSVAHADAEGRHASR
jgi:hypothetical protein